MFLIYLGAVEGVSPNDPLSAKKDRGKQSYLTVIIAWPPTISIDCHEQSL